MVRGRERNGKMFWNDRKRRKWNTKQKEFNVKVTIVRTNHYVFSMIFSKSYWKMVLSVTALREYIKIFFFMKIVSKECKLDQRKKSRFCVIYFKAVDWWLFRWNLHYLLEILTRISFSPQQKIYKKKKKEKSENYVNLSRVNADRYFFHSIAKICVVNIVNLSKNNAQL